MAPGVSSCRYREVPSSISFSGSGFMATYQLGVAQCLLNHAPWILRTAPCVLGASAGSLVAAAVVCEMNLITIRDEMLYFAKQMKAFTLGPFNPSINVFHWLKCILHKHLPSDAHRLANGHLAVSMTRLIDSKNTVVSEFHSKEDVVQALLCSCFVPVYCGMLPPSFKGVHYMDGGFSSMQPVLPLSCSHTLTVSPFSGEVDICPADTPSMWDMVVGGATLKGNMENGLRIVNALYPIELETLEQAYHSGYKDAIRFLLRNDLAPYLMTHNIFQGAYNYNRNTTLIGETTVEEHMESTVKNKSNTLTSFTVNKGLQTSSSTEHQSTGKLTKEAPLLCDTIKDVLLSNLVTYLSMFGLPARILSYLLVPLMLSFFALLQSRHRLELLFRQAPELGLVWYALRCFTFFFFNVFVCSLKKNIKDRVMCVVLLLRWLKVPWRHRHSTRAVHFPLLPAASHGRLTRRFITQSSQKPETSDSFSPEDT